jgi:hypothetical protein
MSSSSWAAFLKFSGSFRINQLRPIEYFGYPPKHKTPQWVCPEPLNHDPAQKSEPYDSKNKYKKHFEHGKTRDNAHNNCSCRYHQDHNVAHHRKMPLLRNGDRPGLRLTAVNDCRGTIFCTIVAVIPQFDFLGLPAAGNFHEIYSNPITSR